MQTIFFTDLHINLGDGLIQVQFNSKLSKRLLCARYTVLTGVGRRTIFCFFVMDEKVAPLLMPFLRT